MSLLCGMMAEEGIADEATGGRKHCVVGKCQAVPLKDLRSLNLPRGSQWERSALVRGGCAFQRLPRIGPWLLHGIAL